MERCKERKRKESNNLRNKEKLHFQIWKTLISKDVFENDLYEQTGIIADYCLK